MRILRTWPIAILWLACAVAAANELDAADPDPALQALHDERVRLFNLAEELAGEQKWADAARLGEQFLAVERKMFGDTHEVVLSSLAWLAEYYESGEIFATAIKVRSEAVSIAEQLFPAESWQIVDARLSLRETETAAKLSADQRRALREADAKYARSQQHYQKQEHAQALALARQAAAERKPILGEEHRAYISALVLVGAATIPHEGQLQAEPVLRLVLKLRKKVQGDVHPDTAMATRDLAQTYAWMGDFEKALPLQREALELSRKIFGDEHAETVAMMTSLAAIHRATGDFEQALPLYRQAVEIRHKVLGREHLDTATALEALAVTYQKMEDFRKADPVFCEALDIRLKVSGVEDLGTAETMNSLGLIFHHLEEFEAAEALLQQVVTTRRKLQGETHLDTELALRNLGSLYQSMARYAQAEDVLLQAWRITQQRSTECTEAVTTLNELSVVASARGNPAKARQYALQAVEISRRVSGDDHPDTAYALDHLAAIYQALGDYASAEPLSRRTYEIFRAVKGETHSNTVSALNNLAILYSDMGDHSKAEPLLRQVVELRKKSHGEKSPQVAAALTSLGAVYASITDYKSAGSCYKQALDIYVDTLGREHPETAICLNNFSMAARFSGFLDEALELAKMALEINKKVFGDDHQTTVSTLGNLAMVYLEKAELDTAQPLLEEAADSLRRILGDKHPLTASHLNKLASLYQQRGDSVKAEPLAREGVSALFEHLENTFSVQSERQKLATLADLRSTLDFWLSVAIQARRPAEELYTRVLTWKGVVFASEAAMRSLAADPNSAESFAQYQEVSRQLATAAMAVPRNVDERAKRDARLLELTEQKEAIEKQLTRLDAHFDERRKGARLSPRQLQAVLPADAVLVDFFEFDYSRVVKDKDAANNQPGKYVSEKRLIAFAVRNGQPVAPIDLGRLPPIAKAIDRWRSCLGNWEGPADEDPGRELRRLLWDPIAASCGDATTVLISPDGGLSQLPFAALPGDKPGEFLLHRYAFATIAVPQLLPHMLADDARPLPAATPSLLLVGGVDYGGPHGKIDEGVSRSVDRAASLADFKALPGTLKEIKSVDDGFHRKHRSGRSQMLEREAATEEAFRRLAPQYRWLHLSTHGFFAPDKLKNALGSSSVAVSEPTLFSRSGVAGFHPGLLSGLAMAGANNKPKAGEDDGILTALEVASLDLSNVDMAVLSACETGLGRVAGGEGVLGLQRAFQVSGTKTVVASLWSVGDLATMRLMQRFYANLWDRNLSKLAALREAQLWLLSDPANQSLAAQGSPTAKAKSLPPQFWAAFVLSGDWR